LQGSPSQNLAGVAVFASVFVSIMGGGTSTSFAGIQSIGALEDVYITHSELGSGKYAKCFEAEARHAQGEIVAIKSMYKSHKYFKKSRVIEEISAWQGLRHKNVVRLLAAYEDPTAIWMVQELCGGGDLQSRLRSNGPLAEGVARGIARQLFCAVAYLHSMGVTHRDIKPANVLMVSSDQGSLSYNDVKLCDFGLAHVGCAVATRPELETSLVDVWSVGVLMYETIAGCHPFSEWGDLLRGHFDLSDPVWGTVSPAVSDCIKHVLVPNFVNRPTASEALLHPWLSSLSPFDHSRSTDMTECCGNRLSMRQRVRSAVRSPLTSLRASTSPKGPSVMNVALTSRARNERDPDQPMPSSFAGLMAASPRAANGKSPAGPVSPVSPSSPHNISRSSSFPNKNFFQWPWTSSTDVTAAQATNQSRQRGSEDISRTQSEQRSVFRHFGTGTKSASSSPHTSVGALPQPGSRRRIPSRAPSSEEDPSGSQGGASSRRNSPPQGDDEASRVPVWRQQDGSAPRRRLPTLPKIVVDADVVPLQTGGNNSPSVGHAAPRSGAEATSPLHRSASAALTQRKGSVTPTHRHASVTPTQRKGAVTPTHRGGRMPGGGRGSGPRASWDPLRGPCRSTP